MGKQSGKKKHGGDVFPGSKAGGLQTTWVRQYKLSQRMTGGRPCLASMAGYMKEMGRDKTRVVKLR